MIWMRGPIFPDWVEENEHLQEAVGRGVVVNTRKLGHLCAAIAKLRTRATGLGDRHPNTEGRDLLCYRLHETLDAPLRRVAQRSPNACFLTSPAQQALKRASIQPLRCL